MSTRHSPTLVLMLAAMTSGCSDSPCADFDGPRLNVWPAHQTDRLDAGAATAFSSIQDALRVAEPGSAVCVAPGIYEGPVRVDVPGVSLLGASPEQVVIEPAFPGNDPRDANTTLVTIAASQVEVKGFTLRGAARGVWVKPDQSATLSQLVIEDNGIGLLANRPGSITLDEVVLARNLAVGAMVTGTLSSSDTDGAQLEVLGGAFTGNGTLGLSEVGGLYSELPTLIRGTLLRDNAGDYAADLLTVAPLQVERMLVERPNAAAEAPRIVALDGFQSSGFEGHTAGSTLLRVRCSADSGLDIRNSAFTDTTGEQPAVVIEDCTGRLAHLTVVNLASGASAMPVSLSGGPVELVNSALAGYSPLGGELAGLQSRNNFDDTLERAAFIRPLAVHPDLRPQSDSPLVDNGQEVGVQEDLDGRPRPNGVGPDLGAFELY